MRHLRILPLTIPVMFSQPFEDDTVVQNHYNPITSWHMIRWWLKWTHTLKWHKERLRSHSWAMQPEIFWHLIHKLNNHIANAFNVKEQPFSWPSCACHLALSASEKGSLAFLLLLWKPFLFQNPLSRSSPLPTAPPVRCLWRPVIIRGWH